MNINFYKTYFEIEKNHWLMKVRRSIIFDVFFKLYQQDKIPALKVLDYGCGSGFIVGELQKMGIKAFGVDMSEEAISYGTSRGISDLSVLKNHLTFAEASYDVILAMDVLEHIKDESMTISDIVRVLKPGGYLIVTVPAYMFLWGVQDEVSKHFRRYTKDKLSKVFSKYSNLFQKRMTYFNTFLFLPIACVRIFSRIFHIRNRESDYDINNKFLNNLFYWIFNCERYILRYMNFPFGVSLLVVLKKK